MTGSTMRRLGKRIRFGRVDSHEWGMNLIQRPRVRARYISIRKLIIVWDEKGE